MKEFKSYLFQLHKELHSQAKTKPPRCRQTKLQKRKKVIVKDQSSEQHGLDQSMIHKKDLSQLSKVF
ncbi:unnamed protein product [Paramecium sonneborni]|uniref:Uncharacterized protein n=1 Tax=Paramecium sonneborni TaxID=65129 RepID=A0A8S1M7E1_9CILI|nr:unnamed protein product [Paramecium sonneborni]